MAPHSDANYMKYMNRKEMYIRNITNHSITIIIIIIIMYTDVRLNKPLIDLYDDRTVEQLFLHMFV